MMFNNRTAADAQLASDRMQLENQAKILELQRQTMTKEAELRQQMLNREQTLQETALKSQRDLLGDLTELRVQINTLKAENAELAARMIAHQQQVEAKFQSAIISPMAQQIQQRQQQQPSELTSSSFESETESAQDRGQEGLLVLSMKYSADSIPHQTIR